MERSERGAEPREFQYTPNMRPTDPVDRVALDDNLAFVTVFTGHHARPSWSPANGWSGHRVEALGHIGVHPGPSGLNYGQQVFEALKAYRWPDGSVHLMRPRANAARFAASARRIALPELPEADFVAALEALVRA